MKRSLLFGLLKYAVGIVIIGWLVSTNWDAKIVNGQEVSPGLHQVIQNPIHPIFLVLAFILSIVSLLLTLIRWHLLVRALDLPFQLYDAIRLGLCGYFFNSVLPSGVGGDVVKAVALYKSHPERRTQAVSTILIDRIVGLWAMFLIVAGVGAYFWIVQDPIVVNNEKLKQLLFIPFITIIVTTVVWFLVGFLSRSWTDKVEAFFLKIPKLGKPLSQAWIAVLIYRQRSKAVAIAILICLISNTGWVLAYHCAASIFEVTQNPKDIATVGEDLLITPTGMALQAFVPTPGGVGGGEICFRELYKLIGKPGIVGFIMCFTVRMISYTIGFLGYAFYLLTEPKSEKKLAAVPAIEPVVEV